MRWLLRFLKRLALAGIAFILLLSVPIIYVETMCRNNVAQDARELLIEDAAWRRPEARTFLTFPEWQIVYAYDEFAKVLETGDEHDFGYARSIAGFWCSYCAINREADLHGGADWATRSMIYTIGISFTVEMAAKALYEETAGRLFASLRGGQKSPQDLVSAEMARRYADFLHQTPWYKFPFADESGRLWNAPLDMPVRGTERRLALGLEWWAKQKYAGVIDKAVAATGPDNVRMRSAVAGIDAEALEALPGVSIIAVSEDRTVIETPRYREFTLLLPRVLNAGGKFLEIAGNDDIMFSALGKDGATWPSELGREIVSMVGQGTGLARKLVVVKTDRLAEVFRDAPANGFEIEHVYDY